MEESEIVDAFEMVNRFGKLEAVKILGGEPTLYLERLIRTVELARAHGAFYVILITSGWWGKEPARAAHLATSLVRAGLSLLVISTDSFHAPYVPLQYVRGAIRAAADTNLQACIAMDIIESVDANNPYDRQTRELLRQLQDVSLPFTGSKVALLGRAAELLSQFSPQSDTPFPNSCQPPYAGSFENPSGIAIDPLGYVTLCHGIAIGNTRTKPLATILGEYRLEDHPILSTISKDGPLGLLKLLGPEEALPAKGYAHACHLCYDLRSRLRDRYPEYLAPGNCYHSPPDGSNAPRPSTRSGKSFPLPLVTS
jgi:hypothetical protein